MKTFSDVRSEIKELFKSAPLIAPLTWQGKDVSKSMFMQTYEILNHSSTVQVQIDYQDDIAPDLPWADDHFEERVSGYPLNPGTQWANWREGEGARKFLLADGTFNHSYSERIWPKFARKVPSSKVPEPDLLMGLSPRRGILYDYGDLNDVVNLLKRDPLTRQAFLPMFFPEDTGAVHGGRAPCSLGWHFIRRDDKLHCVYYLRSCDVFNHWRNDMYMAVRLLLWVLEKTGWIDIKPGTLTTHITSLHCFRGQYEEYLNT